VNRNYRILPPSPTDHALDLKVLFIVLALGGLATLWMAIAADIGASLLVIFNAPRLLDGTKE
jgi:Cd2+/Zn2+-exporting ATPase